MLLFHGSNVVVDHPQLIHQNHFLDCGFGIYTTTNLPLAAAFADKVFKRRRTGDRIVKTYLFDEDIAYYDCSLLRFDEPDESWLDFVSANRIGKYTGEEYDIIHGSVADDDVYTTFNLFISGVLTKQQTLDALLIKKLYNQMVFTSEKALGYLIFKEANLGEA